VCVCVCVCVCLQLKPNKQNERAQKLVRLAWTLNDREIRISYLLNSIPIIIIIIIIFIINNIIHAIKSFWIEKGLVCAGALPIPILCHAGVAHV